MPASNIVVLENAQALHVRVAEEIAHIAGEAICTHGEFTLCLTGGSTPAGAYELLATRFHLSVDWKEVQFFWGDERCVPPGDEASNYGMANRTMLSKLTLQPSQVHRIHGERPPAQAARDYETDLRNFFPQAEDEFPRFDLILLGLGENAHIASLFPQHAAIHENQRLTVAVEVDAPQRHRVSLTAPVLNHAARVIFLVSGEAKARAVYDVLEGPRDPDRFPGQIIAPADGEVLWLVDRAAAGKLHTGGAG
ncbi:MAG: 6-phosphogluconolactonase [Candidatus Binataceae bacterium]